MKQSVAVRGTQWSEKAERSSRSLGQSEGGEVNRNGKSLARQADDGELDSWKNYGWKSITKTDDHFDLPPFILSSPSRSAWLSGHVSHNAET